MNNYFRVSNKIFELKLRPIEFLVYSYLTRCADKNSRCFPSISTISNHCGVAKSSVQKAVNSLTDKKIIIKQSNFSKMKNGKRRRRNNTYYLPDYTLAP